MNENTGLRFQLDNLLYYLKNKKEKVNRKLYDGQKHTTLFKTKLQAQVNILQDMIYRVDKIIKSKFEHMTITSEQKTKKQILCDQNMVCEQIVNLWQESSEEAFKKIMNLPSKKQKKIINKISAEKFIFTRDYKKEYNL